MKKWFVLLAALLVGALGSRVEAATVHSVTVTAPADSGALRGIDSTFVVTTRLIDFTQQDSLEVIMYLATTTDSAVVADTTNASVTFGAIAQNTVIKRGLRKTSAGSLKEGSTTVTGGNLVAVQTKRKRGSTAFKGDADSVAITISGDTTTFRWHGKIHHSSGTVTGVRAAAFAIDDTTSASPLVNDDTSMVTLSAGSKLFRIDADRPRDPSALLLATNGYGGTAASVIFPSGVSPISAVGIGDSIKVNVKLGAQANAVLLGDSLSVVANYFSKNFAVSKGVRSADTLQHRLAITEGLFGDLLTAGEATQAANTDTFAVYVVDLAGNRSGVADDAAAGATAAVSFLVDAKKPALDAQVTGGDTILPVSGDTISDGTLHTDLVRNGKTIEYPHDGAGPRPDKILAWNLPEALDSLVIGFDGGTADATAVIKSGLSKGNAALGTSSRRILDFTNLGNQGVSDTLKVADSTGANAVIYSDRKSVV